MGVIKVKLSEYNVMTLLSKLWRSEAGGETERTIITPDDVHVTIISDEEAYADGAPGAIHADDRLRVGIMRVLASHAVDQCACCNDGKISDQMFLVCGRCRTELMDLLEQK